MYAKYHQSLLDIINTTPNIKADKYFGELSELEKGNFIKNGLPIIYIDFVGDDFPNTKDIDITFSLYIVHMSFSKNKITREKTNNEIHDVLQKIYKLFSFKSIFGSDPIKLEKLQKIFDATAAGGYLTIYKKDLSIRIKNPILTGEI